MSFRSALSLHDFISREVDVQAPIMDCNRLCFLFHTDLTKGMILLHRVCIKIASDPAERIQDEIPNGPGIYVVVIKEEAGWLLGEAMEKEVEA